MCWPPGRTITADYARIEGTFRKAFPDYRCKTPISFGLSLYMFDGNQATDAPGESHMRFGVEMISLLHPPQELPAFFHHELFHVYQAQQSALPLAPTTRISRCGGHCGMRDSRPMSAGSSTRR